MPEGHEGATVVWEIPVSLNVLAGTTDLDAQAAANAWAGTTGLDLLAALNAKNTTNTAGNRQSLNKVCNSLAGTSGLEAQAALSKLAGGASA